MKLKTSQWFAVGFTLGGLLAFLDRKNRDTVKNLISSLISKIRKEK